MSLRYNIRRKQKELRHELPPSQYYLIEEIIDGTVGDWDSTNEFDLEHLAKQMGYKSTNKLYSMLKELDKKELIVRKSTRYPRREVLGLNPKLFGQVLTNHQTDLEKKRHLKIVVDNSQNELTKCEPRTHEVGANNSRSVSEQLTKCVLNQPQVNEIIDKKFPSDSYRQLQISSEAKELHAHEERKREYIPKGSGELAHLLERCAKGFGT
jgi:hypothetical protein